MANNLVFYITSFFLTVLINGAQAGLEFSDSLITDHLIVSAKIENESSFQHTPEVLIYVNNLTDSTCFIPIGLNESNRLQYVWNLELTNSKGRSFQLNLTDSLKRQRTSSTLNLESLRVRAHSYNAFRIPLNAFLSEHCLDWFGLPYLPEEHYEVRVAFSVEKWDDAKRLIDTEHRNRSREVNQTCISDLQLAGVSVEFTQRYPAWSPKWPQLDSLTIGSTNNKLKRLSFWKEGLLMEERFYTQDEMRLQQMITWETPPKGLVTYLDTSVTVDPLYHYNSSDQHLKLPKTDKGSCSITLFNSTYPREGENLLAKFHWDNGLLNGDFICYDHDPYFNEAPLDVWYLKQTAYRGSYKNGKLDGPLTYSRTTSIDGLETDLKLLQCFFDQGLLQGPLKQFSYHEGGAIAIEEAQYIDDRAVGLVVRRYQNGKVKTSGNYIDSTLTNEFGILELFQDNLSRGSMKHGKFFSYNEDGSLNAYEQYRYGIAHGTWNVMYYFNGDTLYAKGTYDNGRPMNGEFLQHSCRGCAGGGSTWIEVVEEGEVIERKFLYGRPFLEGIPVQKGKKKKRFRNKSK